MTADELIEALQNVPKDVELVKNQVGNLTFYRGREWAGYIDLRTGEVRLTSPCPADGSKPVKTGHE